MKKFITTSLLLITTAAYSSVISIPDFTVKLETSNPNIDLSLITLEVRQRCEKINFMSGDRSGASVFDYRYTITGDSNNEYRFSGKKLVCNALAGTRIYLDIRLSTGKFIYGNQVEGRKKLIISSEELDRRFELPVMIE